MSDLVSSAILRLRATQGERREIRRQELIALLVKPSRATIKLSARIVIIFVCVTLVLKASLVEAFFIPSSSMTPTLRVRDYILVPKFLYGLRVPLLSEFIVRWAGPNRGDVIVFTRPLSEPSSVPREALVKRVIGISGDVVEMLGARVIVNGVTLTEPYAHWDGAASNEHYGPYVVPADAVFVLGDNRDDSDDSRFWQSPFVSLSDVIGKAVMVYWSGSADQRIRAVL